MSSYIISDIVCQKLHCTKSQLQALCSAGCVRVAFKHRNKNYFSKKNIKRIEAYCREYFDSLPKTTYKKLKKFVYKCRTCPANFKLWRLSFEGSPAYDLTYVSNKWPACVLQAYQATRTIDPARDDPRLKCFETTRPLRLFDLVSPDMRETISVRMCGPNRFKAYNQAHTLHMRYQDLDGICYPSRLYRKALSIILFERALDAISENTLFDRYLKDASLFPHLDRIASSAGYYLLIRPPETDILTLPKEETDITIEDSCAEIEVGKAIDTDEAEFQQQLTELVSSTPDWGSTPLPVCSPTTVWSSFEDFEDEPESELESDSESEP